TGTPCGLPGKFLSHRQKPEESVDRFLRDLRELASKAFTHLAPIECERNICERFCMGLRNRDLQNKSILKPAESLSVALTKAKGCKALEQLDQKRAAEDSICSALRQHPLTPEPLPPTKPTSCPLDPKASCSLIHSRLTARPTNHRTAQAKPVRLLAANGTEMQVASSTSAGVQLGSFSGEHQFLACPHLQWKAILGMDFLGHVGGVLNLKEDQMVVGSFLVSLKKGRPADVCSTVDSKAEAPFEIGVLTPLRSDGSLLPMTTQLIQLLSEFKDVIALGNDAPGGTNLVQHEIDTSDHRPIRQAPWRLLVHYEQHLDRMITEMLEKRIIRPSVSPWSSPVALVIKKNGTLRLCVDYRKLNEITAKDPFPIPRIDATLDILHGAQWFSALDLASGYWQVEEKLTMPPILAFPDVSDGAGKFVLDTDASNVSIGALLSQETPDGEVVIAYASRCLDNCERNCSTTRRELLALIHFLRHFRPYLLGKPFKERTDHQSPQWLRNFRDSEGQAARW
ncbi:uncharacterized protein DEA37_0010560, partial [Paragonimus westermani]